MGMSPFLLEIRRLVGHRLLLLPAISLIIRDRQDRLLLGQAKESGVWCTIGGMVEPDESPIEAAHREAHEEIGVPVEIGRLIGAFGGPQYRVTYSNDDQASYVIMAYEATLAGEPTADDDELSTVAWFEPGELDGLDLGSLNRQLLIDVGVLTPTGL